MNDNAQPVSVVGIVWFREDDFEAARRLMADGDTLPDTYADWLDAARLGEQHQRRAGYKLVRALIRSKDFKAWCKARDLELNASARTAFAAWYAKEAAARGELD